MTSHRAVRAAKRQLNREYQLLVPKPKKHAAESSTPSPNESRHQVSRISPSPILSPISPSPHTSRQVTPVSSDCEAFSSTPLSTPVGEVLFSDYTVHELPSEDGETSITTNDNSRGDNDAQLNVVVSTALIARIDVLEAQNKCLLSALSSQKRKCFRIDDISRSDSFYTGFGSYEMLLNFFEFLGPAAHNLNYWRSKHRKTSRKRSFKLDPLNQFFLVMIKLRLNLRERDLAHRFGISVSTVSKYFITWICFLYCHLEEINWMPSVEQVKPTMPQIFKEKYPNTYAIIDATELFIETPSDLQMQSSSWSSYKHNNTGKILVACTPNGAICYVSEMYFGSISDVELTRVCQFVPLLKGKENISVMADRGFTVRDQLSQVGVELNIPPFLDGRQKLTANEVSEGRKIASVRIHVERAIGRIKNFSILKGKLPLSLARIFNQIVRVCAWLVNFQPVLIPPPVDMDDDSVEEYFESLGLTSDSDYDADSEPSDTEQD